MNCKLLSMRIKYIYIQPKYTADSAGMIKHSCLVLHAQFLCLYLFCLFISSSLQSSLSLSFPLPFSYPLDPCFLWMQSRVQDIKRHPSEFRFMCCRAKALCSNSRGLIHIFCVFDPIRLQVLPSSTYLPCCN